LARVFSTLLVLGLLGGTAAAFAVTEKLKLEKSPIANVEVTKTISPVCTCPSFRAMIKFRLRKTDRLTVAIVDSHGNLVRTLRRNELLGRGIQRFAWNGRDDRDVPVPDGSYQPRIHFARAHRTILMPSPIAVDTVPPRARVVRITPRVFSPDHDFRADLLRVRFRFSEDSRALLYVDGVLRMKVKQYVKNGVLRWNGNVDGRPLPAGTYGIELRGEDRAGNLSAATPTAFVRIRYVTLAPRVVHVAELKRFGVRVSTDAKRYRWRLGKRHGTARRRVLVLRAGYQGRYRLVVTASGHSATTIVLVGRR
jgi:hypothetical protein